MPYPRNIEDAIREARQDRADDAPHFDDRPSRQEIEKDADEDRYPGTTWDEAA